MNPARAPLSKFLPFILFAICLAIAGILAWAMPSQWPAALGLALSGAGIGLAMRALGNQNDTRDLERQVVSLRQENTTLNARIDKSFSMIDELADVVEQVATMAAEDSGPSVQHRLSALEAAGMAAPVALASSVAAAPVAAFAATEADSIPLTPLFDAKADPATDRDPAGYILGGGQEEDRAAVSQLLARLVTVASGLEAAGREVRLFLRLSPDALAQPDVVSGILSATENSAVQRRLTILTSQAGFDYEAKDAVSRIFDRGCPYALEGVGEWSPSLGPMGRAGLDFVVADATRVVEAADGDDPASLSRTLRENDIKLIVGGIADDAALDAVRKLDPTFVIGPASSGA